MSLVSDALAPISAKLDTLGTKFDAAIARAEQVSTETVADVTAAKSIGDKVDALAAKVDAIFPVPAPVVPDVPAPDQAVS